MNYKDIMNAYLRIRKIDNTIPDEVLEFMKDAAIEKLQHKLTNIEPPLKVPKWIDDWNSSGSGKYPI